MINIIAAVAKNRAIGLENKLLYWLPNDLKRFKALTTGHTIIMGRRTYESLPKGALPNRRNIVLSRHTHDYPHCECYSSLDEALSHCAEEEEVFVIGGASVYEQAMPIAHRLYLTEIDDTPADADAFFPPYDGWTLESREEHPIDERHSHRYAFANYVSPNTSHGFNPSHTSSPLLKSLAILLMVFHSLLVIAQRHEVIHERIASLQVRAGNDWQALLPIIQLHEETPIHIDFDDFTHEYHRYIYKVEHCEADWTLSEDIFTSDYVDGFNDGQAIDDMEESFNTNVLYTHYHLQIPNEQCRLKMSGNYRVTVYDENNDNEVMFKAYFMVVDPIASVMMEATGNTDIDFHGAHQQVSMEVGYGKLNVTDPERQIHTVVMQNGRWDNARINAKPQYVKTDGLRWDHCRDFIFPAGNEYHKFEMLDVTHTTLGLESVSWDGHNYHAYVWTDPPRPNYVYDEDANGVFIIRNSDNYEINRLCDYLLVHFKLKTPQPYGDIYLNGQWTNDQFLSQYLMEYDATDGTYNATILLKQGYYSYQYLWMKHDGTLAPVPSEGSFYQTENTYQALVYYRATGDRTDQLVGVAEIRP